MAVQPPAKRQKLESKLNKQVGEHSHLSNNILKITLQTNINFNQLKKCVQKIERAELREIPDENQLQQFLSIKDSTIKFFLLKFNDHFGFYIIAHPQVCSENDLVNILKSLINSYEKKTKISKWETPKTFWQSELTTLKTLLLTIQLDLNLSMHYSTSSVNGLGKLTLEISSDIYQKILQLKNVKQSTFFLSLFQIFLYKYTTQEVFAIKTFISSIFKNSACVPCHVTSEKNFLGLLLEVENFVQLISSTTHVPYDVINSELLQNKTLDIQFMFYPQISDEMISSWLPAIQNNITLGLYVCEKKDNFDLTFYYNKNLFSEDTTSKMLLHFNILLESVLDAPGDKIRNYSLLTVKDLNLLHKWNDTKMDLRSDVLIHEMFEEQVKISPSKPAITFKDELITYKELAEQCTCFSSRLVANGVNSGSVIAVCMEKSIDLIVVYLSILKTGSCYVPVDPNFPIERNEFLIRNSNSNVIITHKSCETKIPAIKPILIFEVVKNAGDSVTIKPKPTKFPSTTPAYVIHTSGTTGKPKGVVTKHKNVTALIQSMIKAFGSVNSQGILIPTSPNFCLFHGLLYYSLSIGSTAILTESVLHLPETKFIDLVTFIALPPGVLRQITNQLPNGLKTIVLGGDLISSDFLVDLKNLKPEVEIFSSYGCTETTLFDMCVPMNHEIDHVSVGRPMSNVRLYILDKDGQKVPVNFQGELCVSGPQVVDGYLNLPAESANKFFKNSFDFESGHETVYKTGDLARWTDDGCVEILGRMDFMVKINGIRIELDEIAKVLMENCGITEAVVNVDRKILVAYFVPKFRVSVNDIRNYLKIKLPHYMMPQIFVQMEKLPRNVNGKIDRSLLPPPSTTERQPSYSSDVIPHTQTQSVVITCIENILCHRLNLGANFLEEGLDSLLATQLLVHLEKEFGIKLSITLIYDSFTVGNLCKNIEAILDGKTTTGHDVDLLKEAILRPEIKMKAELKFDLKRASDPNYIFLTGATGFIGAFILAELLTKTQATIYCLVRAENRTSGFQRLKQNAEFYELWEEKMEERINVLNGDLTKPKLGLTDNEYETMTSITDIVYHSAATVNFLLPYSAMKNDINEILKFCFAVRIKPFHFVSSIAVHGFKSDFDGDTRFENDNLNKNVHLIPKNGYAQMKWVTEKLVQTAADRGLPVTIYRPSFVSGQSKHGQMSIQEFVTRFIKDCIDFGVAPDIDAFLQLVPVDFVSKCVVKFSLDEKNFGKAFHLVPKLVNDLTINKLVDLLVLCGYKIEKVNPVKWLEKLESNENCALFTLLDFIKQNIIINCDKQWHFDDHNVRHALAGSDIELIVIDFNYVKRLVNFLVKKNFIKSY